MYTKFGRLLNAATLLAVNLLFLMVWGFAAISKVRDGIPPWFGEKFGSTFLGTFPGPAATFWLLTAAELLVFGLALVALLRGEFRDPSGGVFLRSTLGCSLFVFLMLGFGQWLTKEFNGAFQQFVYFVGTLVAIQDVDRRHSNTPAS